MGCCTSKNSKKEKIIAALDSVCSLVDASMLLCRFLQDYREGKPIQLEPLKKEYTVETESSKFAWDLDRMTTDLEDWDGKGFDGLERDLDRDEIAMVILKALIASGSCVNTITTFGRTALQVTVLAGDLVYCKELIGMEADIHKKDEEGETALSLARKWNNQPKDLCDIIKYLESLK